MNCCFFVDGISLVRCYTDVVPSAPEAGGLLDFFWPLMGTRTNSHSNTPSDCSLQPGNAQHSEEAPILGYFLLFVQISAICLHHFAICLLDMLHDLQLKIPNNMYIIFPS